MRRTLVLAVACLLFVVAPAGSTERGFMQVTLNPDGGGAMLINSQTDPPGETWATDTCAPPGTGCVPFALGQMVNTSGAPAGIVFVATASDGPTASSPVWHGNVSATSPPAVTGAVRANALVTPVPATWVGGWTGDFEQTQLAACVTQDGGECTTLTDTHYVGGCPGGAAVIDPAFTGQYLRVADQRFGTGTAFPLYAVSWPYSTLSVWPAAAILPTTATDVVAAAGHTDNVLYGQLTA